MTSPRYYLKLKEIKKVQDVDEVNALLKENWEVFDKYTLNNEPTTFIMARYEKILIKEDIG